MKTNQMLAGESGTAALATAQTRTPSLTRNELISHIASLLRRPRFRHTALTTLLAIEHQDETAVRAVPIAGTALEPVAEALGEVGIATDGTVGSIMDAVDLDHADMHALVCECHTAMVSGDALAGRFEGRKRHDDS